MKPHPRIETDQRPHPVKSATRRSFVKRLTVASAAPFLATSRSWAGANAAPSERLNVGFIGVGVRARGILNRTAQREDIQVVAVCDVVDARRDHAKETTLAEYGKGKADYRGVDAYTDMREVLDRDDIDAVVIGTPDHWHTYPCVMAARSGKDIYCEKPLTLTIGEGIALTREIETSGVVFQTGSQQRSEYGGRFRRAVELVRNGAVGEIQRVSVGVGPSPVPCDLPAQPVPEGVHWDLWLGPAPERAYHEDLCPAGVHRHFPAFRKYREFAGGSLADMGAHHFDIVQWALDMDHSGPSQIIPPESPADRGLKFVYANGVELIHGGENACEFMGTKGALRVNRGNISSDPKSILETELGADAERVYYSDNHFDNWVDCIRSRQPTICPASVGHRSASVCHLANIGYQLRRPLTWDPARERFESDEEANDLIHRTPRAPWALTG